MRTLGISQNRSSIPDSTAVKIQQKAPPHKLVYLRLDPALFLVWEKQHNPHYFNFTHRQPLLLVSLLHRWLLKNGEISLWKGKKNSQSFIFFLTHTDWSSAHKNRKSRNMKWYCESLKSLCLYLRLSVRANPQPAWEQMWNHGDVSQHPTIGESDGSVRVGPEGGVTMTPVISEWSIMFVSVCEHTVLGSCSPDSTCVRKSWFRLQSRLMTSSTMPSSTCQQKQINLD